MQAPYRHVNRTVTRARLSRARSLVAMLGLCFSTAVSAFSIGHARVESGYEEPLQFSVLVRGISAQELAQLKVQMAPVSAWQELGLEPLPMVLNAELQLQPGPTNDTVVLRFFGQKPAPTQVIDALIDVQVAGEQQRHQVSMLQQPRPMIELPTQTEPAAEPTPAPAVVSAVTSLSAPEHVEVRAGDTLHAIAQRIGSPHGSEFQVLAALYRLNPEAFSHKNMNLLLAGETLVLPDAQQIQTLSDTQARHKYADHLQRFNRYKEALARGVSADEASAIFTADAVDEPLDLAPVETPDSENSQSDSKQDASSSQPTTEHGDRLRLAEAQGSDPAVLSADDVRAREKALAHVEQEVAELESQVERLGALAEQSVDELSNSPSATQAAGSETVAHLGGGTASSGSAADATVTESTATPAGAVVAAAASSSPVTKGDLSSKAHRDLARGISTGEKDVSWLQEHFIKLMLALLLFIVIFTIWILRRANKTTVELESPDRVTPEMIQAKLDDINLDLDVPPSDERDSGAIGPER